MARTMLSLRIEKSDKELIQNAAAMAHTSLTDFIMEAALGAAARIKQTPSGTLHANHTGNAPDFFTKLCDAARKGGKQGYETAGRELALRLMDLPPKGFDAKEWQRKVRHVKKSDSFLHDDEALIEWMKEYHSCFISLVPRRRYDRFLAGIRQGMSED